MSPRKKVDPFPKVSGVVGYGKDPNKRPLLFEALEPVVAEADANGGLSSWRQANVKPISQLRSAAAAHGYKINVSLSESAGPVFRLNGKIKPEEAS